MKKAILWAASILLWATAGYAQDTETPNFSRHQVGLGFTNEANHLGDYYTNNQRWGYGFALQGTYQYRPATWFSLETGLGYKNYANQIGYNVNPIMYVFDGFIAIEPPNIDRIHAVYVPVNLRFHYQRNKVGFFVRTGATANWLLVTTSEQDEDYKYNRYTHMGNDAQDDITLGINMGLGIDYSITERWTIRTETVYSMNNLVAPKEMHLYYGASLRHAVGLNLAVYYTIGK